MKTATKYRIRNLPHRLRGIKAEFYRLLRIGAGSELCAILITPDGERIDLGVVSRRVVTAAGVSFMVDAFQGLENIGDFNFHASGTGTDPENVGDTALGSEVESRVIGVQTEPETMKYRTTGAVTYTGVHAITEHGLFSQLDAGGTLWDRSVFAPIGVIENAQIEFQYTLTINAGG